MAALDKPLRDSFAAGAELVSTAPVRTADIGGWSDTWFARVGVVCNVALARRAQVRLRTAADADGSSRPSTTRLTVVLTGESYRLDPRDPVTLPGRHAMLEQALVELPPPDGVEVVVGDDVPIGGALGGSASVMVALVAALSVARGEGRGRADLARLAHRCEVRAGREAGVQDHVASAFGGISAIDVAYPDAAHTAIHLSPAVHQALERRLITVSFGAAHSSTDVHREVIDRLEHPDTSTSTSLALDRIRAAARDAIDALCADDLDGYGRALTDNHEALRSMHPGTISNEADELAALAASHGATAWKVNGAGGAGGSMVVLAAAHAALRSALVESIARRQPWQVVAAPFDADGVLTTWTDGEAAR